MLRSAGIEPEDFNKHKGAAAKAVEFYQNMINEQPCMPMLLCFALGGKANWPPNTDTNRVSSEASSSTPLPEKKKLKLGVSRPCYPSFLSQNDGSSRCRLRGAGLQ